MSHHRNLNFGRQDARHTIREIENPLEHPDWQKPLQDGIKSYLARLEERGLPGREVYEAALAASESCVTDQEQGGHRLGFPAPGATDRLPGALHDVPDLRRSLEAIGTA